MAQVATAAGLIWGRWAFYAVVIGGGDLVPGATKWMAPSLRPISLAA